MRSIRPVFLLFTALAMSLLFTCCEGGSAPGPLAFVGDSLTLGADASVPANAFAPLVTDYIDQVKGDQQRAVFISVDPKNDLKVTSKAMERDRQIVIIELGVHSVIDQSISADDFRQLYGSLLDCVTGEDTVVVVGTIPWLGWAAVTPEYERATLFSQIIIEEAAKRQVAVADLWSAMKLRLNLISTPQDSTFLDDGQGDNFHPNDAGHAVIAWVYDQALASQFANPPRRSFDRKCH